MKLSSGSIAYMQTVVNTARLVGIDNIIIEAGLVRAIDENKTVVLFQDKDVPDMEFGSIGLNRIDVFSARFDIAKTQDKFYIDAVVEKDDEFTRSLTMKGTGVKIDYRCANPKTIQAPRSVNDTLKFSVDLNGEAVLLLQKGFAAMGADVVTIISNKDGVAFELSDVNNDVFNHTFTDKVQTLTADDSVVFAHRYPAKTILALFKHNPDGTFYIGQKGMLSFSVNDLSVFVLPQV